MDEARESQERPAVPLEYANRVEAADALQAYRLVGTALLLYYCGAIAGPCVAALGYYKMGMSSWSFFLPQGVGIVMDAVGLAGAISMTRLWKKGAWLVVGVAALRVVVQCLLFIAQVLIVRSTRPGVSLMSAGSVTTMALQSAAIALLAYLLWDHCRKRGAWG